MNIRELEENMSGRGISEDVNRHHTYVGGDTWIRSVGRMIAGREIMTTNEWAKKYRVMGRDSNVSKKWRAEFTPYLDAISDSLCSHEPSEQVVVVGKAVQVGMTECAINEVLRRIHIDPCSMLYFMDTKDKMERFIHDRWDVALSMDPFVGMISRRGLSRGFPGGALHMNGAQSATGLSSSPAVLVMGDEASAYPTNIGGEGDFLSLARGRVRTAGDKAKIAVFSKFTDTNEIPGAFYGYWKAGDCREYLCPCPSCGNMWLWSLETLKSDDGGAYQECPKCDGRTYQGDASVQAVGDGYWEPTKIRDMSDVTSYRISGFISPWVSWRKVYETWNVIKKGDVSELSGFYNNDLGLPCDPTEVVQVAPSEARDKMTSKGYVKGEVPDEVIVVTAAVDVQKGRLEYEVKGWGDDLSSYSLEYGTIPLEIQKVDACETELRALLSKRYGGLRIWLAAIDAGGQVAGEGFASHVYALCSRFPNHTEAMRGRVGALIPVMGVSSSTPQSRNKMERNRPGGVSKSGKRNVKPLWTINTHVAKTELYRAFAMDYSADDVHGLAYAPADYDDHYFKGIRSERRELYRPSGNEVRWRFVHPRGAAQNEPLDLHVYNRFCIEILEVYNDSARISMIKLGADTARKTGKVYKRDEIEYDKDTGEVIEKKKTASRKERRAAKLRERGY